MEQFDVIEVPRQTVAVVRRIVPMDDLTAFFGEAFASVGGAAATAGLRIVGEPFGWYFGMPTDVVDVAAGFPVAEGGSGLGGEIVVQERVGGLAGVSVHTGPYDTMVETCAALQSWMAERSLVARGDMWEEYLSEPVGDPSTWKTRIVIPLG